MILMYHHVCPRADIPTDTRQYEREGWRYTLEPRQFEYHLQSLKARGFHFVSLDAYVEAILSTGFPPAQAAVVTFDDGWLDNFQHAFPVLSKHGVSAAFFVVSGLWREVSQTRRMAREHLLELIHGGMTIGSHTQTHCILPRVDLKTSAAEMSGSRADLESLLGHPVRFLAYPGGRFNRGIANAAAECGFEAACSIVGGGANTPDCRMWLYRDTVSAGLNTLRDRIMLSPVIRRVVAGRARLRIKRQLGSPS